MKDGTKRGVILVGHGGVPSDYPRELLARQKALEGKRRAQRGDPTDEEVELDRRIRGWPRTPETDPYQAGLESLAAHFQRLLDVDLFKVAYNEFCAPTLQEAVAALVAQGASEVRVVPSMLTPGGSHSEYEIPETLTELRAKYPGVKLRYAWPFDLEQVAAMLAAQISRF
jgi:sirohydrochlorin cobaltochelatase